MTCIVGIIEHDKVLIGGDSAGVSGLDVTVRKDKKVFRVGDFIFGCTSSFRMIQILKYSFIPPPINDEDIYKYMCTKFVDELRETFKRGGVLHKSNDVEEGGHFLVGYRNRLFTIQADFQVAESFNNYSACGCGESYALGSLYSSSGTAEERLTKALEAATQFSAGVRPPFNIIST